MSSIELIRQEVEAIRKEHVVGKLFNDGLAFCASERCADYSPCLTLRLAEDKLKLALFVANDPGDEAQALLAEVAR